jgi:O-antigen/teichoic acid export membrane protein
MADMGFYYIAVREISKPGADGEKIFSNTFALRFFATLFFVLLAPLVSYLFFDYSNLINFGILIVGLANLATMLIQLMTAIFQYRLKTGQVALMEVIAQVLFVALAAYLIYTNADILPFIWVTSFAMVVNFVLLYLVSRKLFPFHLGFDFQIWKDILRDAWPMGLITIINLFYFRYNIVILSSLKPAADVGIFGAPYKILETLIAVPTIFVGLVIPILSRYFVSDREKFNRAFRKAFDALIIIAVPFAVGTQFIARWIMDIVTGSGYEGSAQVLRILMVAILAMFLAGLAINTVVVVNKQKSLIGVSLLAAGVSVALNYALIPHFSYIGASYATVATEFVLCVFTYVVVYRSIRLRPQFTVALKCLLSGAVMAGALFLLNTENVILNIVVGGVVYSVVLLVTRALKTQDIKSFLTLRKRNA